MKGESESGHGATAVTGNGTCVHGVLLIIC